MLSDTAIFSLKLSFLVAGTATFFVILVSLPVAYVLARTRFPGKELLDIVLTMPLVLPPTVTGYYLIVFFGKNGVIGKAIYALTGWTIMFTWYAAVLAAFVVSLPFMLKTTRSAIESVDRNLIDASYTLGHGEFYTAVKIVIPLSKNGIFAGIALSFTRALGEFGATLMLAGNIPGKTETMPLAIYSSVSSGNWPEANLMALVFVVLSAVLLFIAGKFTNKAI